MRRGVLAPQHGRLPGLRWLVCLLLGLAGLAAAQTGPDTGGRAAVVLQVEGVVGPASADYLARGLATAAERGAGAVVLRMDTPGGLDTSMREIVRAIMASPVPVITFVAPSGARAASAGTFILYASHLAAMAPGTNLGAATPVAIGGSPLPGGGREREEEGRATPRSASEAKAVADAAAYIRSLAELRGRNADWAERAVREAASLSAVQALDQGVIEVVARDLRDLLAQAHGRRVQVAGAEVTLETRDLVVQPHDPDWRARLLAALTNPNVALILMMIGVYGLFFEFMNPGSLYPGTIGAICLLVGLYALAALPLNHAGIALLALGMVLMLAEAFTPAFGVLGIGGALAFLLGATILVDADLPGLAIAWPVIAAIVVTTLAFSLLVARLALRSRIRPVATGREEMIGAPAEVLDWGEGGTGHVRAHGERWRAVSTARLAPGQAVRVTALDGLTLRVEPERRHDEPPRRPRA